MTVGAEKFEEMLNDLGMHNLQIKESSIKYSLVYAIICKWTYRLFRLLRVPDPRPFDPNSVDRHRICEQKKEHLISTFSADLIGGNVKRQLTRVEFSLGRI